MENGSSNLVRRIAAERYILPALRAGESRFSVAVKDVSKDLIAIGFPATNTPQICSALRTRQFLKELGIEIESIEGPPSKQSTTVVYRYRRAQQMANQVPLKPKQETSNENSEAKAKRLAERLRGMLKEELSEYGGGEAFVRWVRGQDEEDAA